MTRIIDATVRPALALLIVLAFLLLLSVSFSFAATDILLNNSRATINTTYRGESGLSRVSGYPKIRFFPEGASATSGSGNASGNGSANSILSYESVYFWTVNPDSDLCPVEECLPSNTSMNATCSFLSYADDLKSGKYSYTIAVQDCAGNERIDEKNFTVDLPLVVLDENCYNNKTDGSETDLNCGGPGCLCCELLKQCKNDTDCCDAYCRQGFCAAPRCDDLIRNGFESDVDCGGTCPGCAENKSCNKDSDCITNFCNAQGKCAYPRCDDGSKNALETDVDCGGVNCSKCSNGMSCLSDSDCESDYCEAGFCACDSSVDTDGDGMDDCWELKYNLDPYDPDDADGDLDDDGVSNLDEYLDGSDPTDPTDPGREESHLLGIILLILGLLLMGGSTGFLIYSRKVLVPKERAQAGRSALGAGQQSMMRSQAQGQRPVQPMQGRTALGAGQQQPGGKLSLAQILAQRRSMRQQGQAAKPGTSSAALSSSASTTSPKSALAAKSAGDNDDGYVSLSDMGKKKEASAAKDAENKGEADKQKSEEAGKQAKLSSVFERLKEMTSQKDKEKTDKGESSGKDKR